MPLVTVHRQIFDLLQHSSELARSSACQTTELAHRVAALSDQLQKPAAVETVHVVVEDLLSLSLQLCKVNLSLARDLDSHADQAVSLLSRALTQIQAQRAAVASVAS